MNSQANLYFSVFSFDLYYKLTEENFNIKSKPENCMDDVCIEKDENYIYDFSVFLTFINIYEECNKDLTKFIQKIYYEYPFYHIYYPLLSKNTIEKLISTLRNFLNKTDIIPKNKNFVPVVFNSDFSKCRYRVECYYMLDSFSYLYKWAEINPILNENINKLSKLSDHVSQLM